MRLQTFGNWTGAISGVGAGALTASPETQYLAPYLALASAVVWVAMLIWFLVSNRREIRSGVTKLGSWYFIIPCLALGMLALAAAAYGLGLRSSPALESSKPQDAAVTSPKPIVAATEPQKRRRYTNYEREQKLPVISEFRDFLEGPMQQIIDEGPKIESSWREAIKDPKSHSTYNGDLEAFFKNLNSSADRMEALRKKYHRHEEIYAVTAPTYWNSAVPKMNTFRVNYDVAAHAIKPDADESAIYVLMNPATTSFEEGLKEFTAWRNSTLGKLSDLERDMSQSK